MTDIREGREVLVETVLQPPPRMVVGYRRALVAETPGENDDVVLVRWERHSELRKFGRFAPMAVKVSRCAVNEIQNDGKKDLPAGPPVLRYRSFRTR